MASTEKRQKTSILYVLVKPEVKAMLTAQVMVDRFHVAVQYLWREWSYLNLAQQDQWVNLFQQSPTLVSTYLLRRTLTAIFEYTPDRDTAQTRLQCWGELVKAAGITGIDKFLTILQH